ncbi:fungal hydrophobin [Coprinopsis marcescibilis]|uniref:Hydrophobin n=1 Tax=Coprinopsis marcescibilis TaxID=230819 RepID=A0A5C3KR03_COPMA|nr:fungal hydrophobin [Coprinopsis marcescibilis]
MIARVAYAALALAFAGAALAAPHGDEHSTTYSQCNGGQVQCCNSVQESNALDAPLKGVLGVLNVDITQLTGQVGVTCTGVNVIGLGGSTSCSNQQVCCNNNNFNGVVALGCTPINASL